MLTEFFFKLREYKVPVTLTEWMTFMEALAKGLAFADFNTFYSLARSLLVKDVAHYDAFDQVFLNIFKEVEISMQLKEEIEQWLEEPIDFLQLSDEEKAMLEALDFDKLKEEFEKRLQEQTERHDGGNRWVGTGGTSPFGHSGYNPRGVRVGGTGGNKTAVQIATMRRFKNYRKDSILDVRQMKVALKKLRVLERVGAPDELALDETISETCKNAGEIELIFKPAKKNRMRLLLLMDAGGSMDPYARLVSKLFSAASQANHFKAFKYYYFHNCIYEHLFSDIYMDERVPTANVLKELEGDWRVIIVGDAAMSPYELSARHGAIYYYHRNETPGIEWLHRINDHYRKVVWLNPIPSRHWWATTIAWIKQIFPMYPLTIAGIEDAVAHLR